MLRLTEAGSRSVGLRPAALESHPIWKFLLPITLNCERKSGITEGLDVFMGTMTTTSHSAEKINEFTLRRIVYSVMSRG